MIRVARVIIYGMKKWCEVLGVVCVMLVGIFGGANAFADVNNFYFEDFTGDYYLSKAEDGTSRLHVKEVLTAVFPGTNQNHGIERYIPFTNQGGINMTVADYEALNLKVTRNGEYEPVSNMGVEDNYFYIRIGDAAKYVQGKQVYILEYDFANVVTEFDAEGNNVSGQNVEKMFQELYWDTNGTSWTQRFDKVTARVHFVDRVLNGFTGKSWCYVGRYGESGQDRCTIVKIDDGVEFTTSGVRGYENLTFDVELKAGTFVVLEPAKNYTLVWILTVVGVGLMLFTVLGPVRRYRKAKEKREYYKKMFVKPEYQPNPDYTVAEMAEVYIGKKKDAKVAVLLDMIVRKKIALAKTGENRKKGWKAMVLSLDGVSEEARTLLAIMNGGWVPEVGDEVEIKAQVATSRLVALGRKYDEQIIAELKKDGLVEEKYKSTGRNASTETMVVVISVVMCFVFFGIIMFYEALRDNGLLRGYVVGENVFSSVLIVMIIMAIVIWSLLYSKTDKYAVRTKKGLETSRYMDGSKLYIGMAEAERLKMLQSVKGADVSSEGVVRLYEKLLPYAAVLGLEESWMAELEKYYKLEGVTEPEWHRNGFTVRDMYYASTLASSYSRSATTMSSGSGGSSSGSSGGGGGGFSGGGGGGGGGGGW